MKPFRSSTFFSDGLSARQPVEGTVPRGYLRTDTALFTGKKNKNLSNISAGASATPAGPQPSANAPSGQNAYPDDNDVHCAVPYFGFVLGSAIGRAEIP